MTDRPLDQREREELCDLLLELGPDAPTLCEGWTTLDLAAHLVIRERDPLASPGILIPQFAAATERRQKAMAAKGLGTVVDKIRSGPPAVPWRVPKLRTLLNLNEYTVHHEDVRRANGLGRRTDRPDLDDAIWSLLKGQAKLATRRLQGAGLDLVRPDGVRHRAKRGADVVELTGHPVELALFLTGRTGAAEVAFGGPAHAIAAVRATRFGL